MKWYYDIIPYIHAIIVSILAYRDNYANDNTVDTKNTKSLSATQCSGSNLHPVHYHCKDNDLLRKKLTFLGTLLC